jgi:hypothetical protein
LPSQTLCVNAQGLRWPVQAAKKNQKKKKSNRVYASNFATLCGNAQGLRWQVLQKKIDFFSQNLPAQARVCTGNFEFFFEFFFILLKCLHFNPILNKFLAPTLYMLFQIHTIGICFIFRLSKSLPHTLCVNAHGFPS